MACSDPDNAIREARPGKAAGLLRFAAFLAGATLVALFFRLRDPSIPDPDSFYHFRHAALYAEKGLLLKSFPWLVYSIINRFSSDIGYGFHVLLIPFTFLRDPVLGARLAAAFETVAVLVMVYAVMCRQRVRYAAAWPFMLLFLGPPMLYTFLMTRPQTLTMGFAALLLSRMAAGSAWGVLLSSLALSFFHLNVFPIIPVIVVVAGVVKRATEGTWEWLKWLAAVVGIGLAWIARPNPLGTARLEYVQVLVHALVRQKRIPLLFGREWLPISLADAGSMFTSFLVVWLLLMAIFLIAALSRRGKLSAGERTFLWSSLLLSLLFFAVTVLNTKRTTPLWGVFAVMFVAQAFTCFVDAREGVVANNRRVAPAPTVGGFLKHDTRLVLSLLVAVLFALMAWDVVNQHVFQRRWQPSNPYRMKAASEWLAAHSRAGEVVFNVDWGMFPELFFWNTRDHYVSGLDPIFLFAYDPKLYWEAHHLATGDGTEYTWTSMEQRPEAREDTYTALRRDFRASYVVLQTRQTPALREYLESDRRFARRFEDGQVAVYEVR